MAAGKCGCAGTTCSCVIKGDGVTGAGSVNNPYIISGASELNVNDTDTINHTLLGDGSTANPWSLSSVATLELGDLEDVDASVTTTGYVPARQIGGGFALVPPSTAPVGAIAAGNSIEGDGSGGDPLDVRLASLSGLEIVAGGLQLKPRTVASEATLDSTYGALPVGSIVSDTDGSQVWVKTLAGWALLAEDTGVISTVSGNLTEATNWNITSVQMSRVNGIVSIRLGMQTVIDRETGLSNGNVGNILVGNLITAEFRPRFDAALRVASAGDDAGFYITSGGNIYLTNFAQPDVEDPAGYQWSATATYVGA